MRNLIPALVLTLFITPAVAQDSPVVGRWENDGVDVRIVISKKGENYSGAIYWLKKAVEADGSVNVDDQNPEPSLRSRPLQGLEILTGLTYKGDGSYVNGSVYNPKSGKSYSCKLTVKGDKMTMRGYIGFSMLGKTETWTRVKN